MVASNDFYNFLTVLCLQECHQQVKLLSQEAAAQVKQHGKSNDMVERILKSSYFASIHGKLKQLLDPTTFIGRAPQQVGHVVYKVKIFNYGVLQVDKFLAEEVMHYLEPYKGQLDHKVTLDV